MTEHDPNQTEDAAFSEGFVGVSLSKLARMPDAELATWQSGWKPGTDKYILAEKEWQRRIALRELREQFKLEERLATSNRWWAMAAAVIGVIGTLAGVGLGKWLDSPTQGTSVIPQAQLPSQTEEAVPSNASTSAASSTSSQSVKKAQ
jgi:hypothetical protein